LEERAENCAPRTARRELRAKKIGKKATEYGRRHQKRVATRLDNALSMNPLF
jgi:hypothetical protein